jgi:hypothetical protein
MRNNAETILKLRRTLVEVDNALEEIPVTAPDDAQGKLEFLSKVHAAQWRALYVLERLDDMTSRILEPRS